MERRNIPGFQEIILSEAINKGYIKENDTIFPSDAPEYRAISYIDCREYEDRKIVRFKSTSWYYTSTIMYLWAIAKWREVGSNYWYWSSAYGEIYGTFLEVICGDLEYPPSMTMELIEEGDHWFLRVPWPPPPPGRQRGVAWGVEPNPPPKPYWCEWIRARSYDAKTF